ncbi:hypothetical protein McanMca71_006105 [Microsporum canis]|uniref:non-specific serine/threonine protein kinase n=1 Tax=Arthroderma otae (strain ATCC MYA-4605 / CBS 113480) TaxID=554155 RepID=C5FNH8_ARTOC|nr:protein kinase domain-containing protein [Microsporum canis CBS 113480]EEQ31592.1 protein kinase domain-containing protein [Microsporum canis CBS 113480]
MDKLLQLGRRALFRAPSPPRIIRNSGFSILDPAVKFEEENMLAFEKGLFYPVYIGETLKGRYQVLSKLGYGANSTVWLCRDLHKHKYTALKILIHNSKSEHETKVLEYLASLKSSHPGKYKIRTMLDAFEISGPDGPHQCLVHEPLLMSVQHLQASFLDKRLTEDMLKPLLRELFTTLDYLHSEAHVIHTDIQAKNIMVGTKDMSVFAEWESQENENPTPRKDVDKYTVYRSRPFYPKKGWGAWGLPLLSDFGDARIGDGEHEGLIQPGPYRAPEVMLGMKWTEKVDIWNVGVLIWDLFEDDYMFDGLGPNGKHSNAHLLAEIVSLLGQPPPAFLQRSKESLKYWDESGTWRGLVEIPNNSLEDSDKYMKGRNQEIFMEFMRKMLRWVPEERQSARELLRDPWLNS